MSGRPGHGPVLGRPGGPPRTLVVKLPSDNVETNAAARQFGTDEREVRFFKVLASDLGVPVPECYYAEADSESGDFVLLLEDLSSDRPDDEANVVLEDVKLVVRNMARLHGRWWEIPTGPRGRRLRTASARSSRRACRKSSYVSVRTSRK
ncbi:MAG TPA: hypothetical protein DGB32_01140 [Dehalococcoidia bacterium]|nr:hypothetical protein [Dehalococcoidia bacterium]